MSAARRVYEWLLCLYPPSFRRRFGPEMSEVFAATYAEHRRRGWAAVAGLWGRTLRDLTGTALPAWLRREARLTARGAAHRPRPRLASTPPPRRLENLMRDVRIGLRQLRRSPAYTAVAIVTLALGIGANSAIFSVVNGILLRPLPYQDQERLVVMWSSFPDSRDFPVSVAEWLDYRAAATSVTDVAAFGSDAVTLSGASGAERLRVAFASRNLFRVLGVEPAVGRSFTPAESRPNGPLATVLSHDFWATRYAEDPGVLGRTIVLDGRPIEVVGILPPGVEPPGAQPHLYLPLQVDRAQITNRSSHWLTAIARLAPGAVLEQADSELDGLLVRWETEFAGVHPNDPELHPLYLVPLETQLFGRIQPIVTVLLGAVGLVLLLACANVANLTLARGEARAREMSVRSALGASRSRLLAQGIVESLLLAAAGGALGLGLAHLGTRVLLALEPGRLPRIDEVTLDGTVVAFTAAVTIGTALLFGLVPSVRGARTDVADSLRTSGRGQSASRNAHRTLGVLATTQMAFAVLLLVGSGLLIRSFYHLQQVDPGFEPTNRVGFDVRLLASEYPDRDAGIRFHEAVLDRLRAIPGVDAAAAARGLPLRNALGVEGFVIEGHTPPSPELAPQGYYHSASPGYFRTMGIPVLRGREFTEADRTDGVPVAIVNQTFVDRYLDGADAVGRRLRGSFAGPNGSMREIVGVVGNVHHDDFATSPRAVVYFPLAQTPTGWAVLILRTPGFVVRTSLDPDAVAPQIREAVRAVDPNVPVTNIATMDTAVANATAGERFLMLLVSTFAVVALAIAAAGVYGVMAFTVARRRREIGIRLALGAAPGVVLRDMLGRGLRIALVGGATGLGLALAASRVMESMVYGIGVRDAVVFATSLIVLGAVAVGASAVPARRASRTSPSATLRLDG